MVSTFFGVMGSFWIVLPSWHTQALHVLCKVGGKAPALYVRSPPTQARSSKRQGSLQVSTLRGLECNWL